MAGPAAPIETFARLLLPAIIDSSMLAGWLADCLTGWLAGGWLASSLADWLAGWLAGRPVGWLTGCWPIDTRLDDDCNWLYLLEWRTETTCSTALDAQERSR